MSFQPASRSNFRPPSGPRLPMRFWPAWRWLILINVIVFFVDVFSSGLLTHWGAFSTPEAVNHLQIWRFLSFQFLHAGPGHILFNMLGIYFFSPSVEAFLGKRQFILFYLLCGLAGACSFIVLCTIRPNDLPLVGASAGIFGVLVAAAVLNPNAEIRFAFTPFVLTLKWFVLIYIGLAIVAVWQESQNAGGEAAHLGGAVLGYILIRNRRLLHLGSIRKPRSRFWKPGDPPDKFFRN